MSRVARRIRQLTKIVNAQREAWLFEELCAASRLNRGHEVQRVIKLFAANSRGPHKRFYKRPDTSNCLSETWRDYLVRPGPEGLCEAVEIDFEEQIDELQCEIVYGSFECSTDVEAQCRRDVDGIRSYCQRAPKRKMTPFLANPLESYYMLLSPNYRLR